MCADVDDGERDGDMQYQWFVCSSRRRRLRRGAGGLQSSSSGEVQTTSDDRFNRRLCCRVPTLTDGQSACTYRRTQ